MEPVGEGQICNHTREDEREEKKRREEKKNPLLGWREIMGRIGK